MSTSRQTHVHAESSSSLGWLYSLKDLEKFIVECRAAGLRDTALAIKADTIGQIGAEFSDPAD